MWHIALEIPLRLFAVARRRQRHHAHHARIEALGDALDDAALAGGIAPLEDHEDFLALGLHPVLELDQLRLQRQQGAEVDLAVDGGRALALVDLAQLHRQRGL